MEKAYLFVRLVLLLVVKLFSASGGSVDHLGGLSSQAGRSVALTLRGGNGELIRLGMKVRQGLPPLSMSVHRERVVKRFMRRTVCGQNTVVFAIG